MFYGRMFALIYTYASRTGVLLAPTLTFAYIVARGAVGTGRFTNELALTYSSVRGGSG